MNITETPNTTTQPSTPTGGHAAAAALRLPAADYIGDTLYLVGFWAEYALLCAARATARAASAVYGYTSRLLMAVLRPIGRGVRGFFGDLARPFAQVGADLRTLRDMARAETGADPGQVLAMRREYLKNSRQVYLRLLWDAFSFLLPLAALIGFVALVRTVLALDYVLDVQVNGQSVGYVQSEQVFESARADVQNRLNNARAAMIANGSAVSGENWSIQPNYTLTVGDVPTMNREEAANAIMSVSGDEIGEGTAVYVDGALQFVTTEGDHLRAYLENIKSPYEDALDVNTHVSFLHDISLEDGIYMLSSIEDYSGVIDRFNRDSEILYYTAGRRETCQSAVENTGINWDSLAQMNPWMETLDQPIDEGTEIVTGASSPEWLKVKVVTRRVYTEAIPYETEKRTSSQYDFGKQVVLQQGQTGEQEITQDLTYIDDQIASADIVSVNILSEPVTEIIVTGTRLAAGMYANPGSGSFVWPVPGYRYVSRWMSSGHKGTDICAAYGTPIIAADSGAVVTSHAWSGSRSGYDSYGNYVVIDHGNGWSTLYAHMSSRAVSVGQTVSKGDIIGYVGQTGRATGPHCHFEMYHNGVRYSARNLWPNM